MLVQLLDVLVSALELLDDLGVLGLEELSLPVVGGLAVVEILLVLQHQSLPPPVFSACAEQPHDVPVGDVRTLPLLARRAELVEDDPAVDGETPDATVNTMSVKSTMTS